MGFAVYWTNIFPVSQAVWDTFVHRALKLVKRRRTGKIDLELQNYGREKKTQNVLTFEGAPEDMRGESFMVSKEISEHAHSDMGFCKTNRHPYTTDVFICLILMYDLGMLRSFSADDMDEQYPEALEYVKSHYALKNSYEKLKRMGIYENNEGNPIKTASPPKQKPRKQRKVTSKRKSAKRVTRKH